MGNKAKCTPIGRGIVVFQTEAGERLRAINVQHVSGLGMNLLSISQLQNKGYAVFFIKEKVYVKHPSWKKKAHIGIRSNTLYRLQLESPMALIDICEPMSTKALSGAEYFVTFIDDYSRKTWIYFLKTKDEVFGRFKEFKVLVKNLTGKKIKVLHSGNGGEYVDNDFTDFCAREGIRREWTIPYNLEQNAVAE
eukprot:PITA_32579